MKHNLRHPCRRKPCLLLLPVMFIVGCQDQTDALQSEPVGHSSEVEQSEADETIVEPSSLSEDKGTEASLDEQYRVTIVGTWEDEYQGKRTLTVRADGTATMVVELEGLAATLYAKRMTFEEEWEIKDGVLTTKLLGGEPKTRVDLIISTMGENASQEILELTAERMHLKELKDGGATEYDWRRVDDDSAVE